MLLLPLQLTNTLTESFYAGGKWEEGEEGEGKKKGREEVGEGRERRKGREDIVMASLTNLQKVKRELRGSSYISTGTCMTLEENW